jgi:hypothetical protein
VNLNELSELSKNAMLIEVIENPLRFWFGIVVPAQAATVRRAKAMGQLPGR